MATQEAAASPEAASSAGIRWSVWKPSAPPRPPLRTVAIAFGASAVGLLTLAVLSGLTGNVFLIPPLAASMALVVGAPKLPLSQPRNVIGGQIVSAAVGVLVGLVSHALWAGALAGALALAAMMLCRMPHSPAAATAVIGATTASVPGWQFVLLAGAAAGILVVVGVIGNRLNGVPEYPVYIW